MVKKIIIASLAILGLGLLSFVSTKETPFETSKIETISTDSSFAEIYPTTFQTQIFVKGKSTINEEIRVEVFDMTGLLIRTFVLEDQLTNDGIPLNMSDLTDETYIVRVYENNELLEKERIFKK